MSVESKTAKVAAISTAIVAISGAGLIFRERAIVKRQEALKKDVHFQEAMQLAQDSCNSGDFGIIFTKNIQ